MTELTLDNTSRPPLAEARLRQVQAIAGSLFGLFVLLHLSNIALAPFGVDIFNHYQRIIRQVYQHPLIEIFVVLGPLSVHAIAGVWLFFLRRGRVQRRRPLVQRLHGWAGAFLLLVIIGHVLAVRGSSYFYGVFLEFKGLTFSLWYVPAYFYPYYFLLALAGFYHATNGLRTLAARNGIAISWRVQLGATMIAGLWIAISLMALGGLLFDVGHPADHEFARLAAKLTGMDPETPVR